MNSPVPSDDTPGSTISPAAPISRRRLLQATAAAGAVAAVAGAPAAAAARSRTVPLSFTAATNGSATLSPSGDRLIAEVQNVLWSVPGDGGDAVALTPADLEPNRPQFSPDGSRLVVCAYRGGGFHLWTLRPDGSQLRQLTEGPWDDRAPSWSPDGTRVAFASERAGDPVAGGPYRIWVLDTGSGELVQLTGLPGQEGPGQDGAWEDFDPAWSPDGERVLFVRATVTEAGALAARTVASVPAGGGAVRAEHADDSGAQLMVPAVSPGGRLAYLRTTPAPAASCTLVVDGAAVDAGGDVAPVPVRWVGEDELLLNVDGRFRVLRPGAPAGGREIPFTAGLPVERPRYRVKRYDFTGGGSRRVRGIHLPALSPDGRTVAFAALNALWTAPVSGGAPRRVVRAEPTRYLLAPSWTPDGRGLVYADDRDGLLAVRRRDLASGEETVLASGGRVFPALSPDGRRLAALDMLGNLVVRELESGEERVLAAPLGGGGLPGGPSWSPDGRRVALCDRNRLNMRFREGYNLIRVVDTETGDSALHAAGPHVSLSDRYASGPAWSPDGRWMALVTESALWVLPVRSDGSPDGEPRRLTSEAADHPSWSGDSRTLLYLSSGRLRTVGVDGGRARTVPVALDYRRPRAADTVVRAGRLWDGTGETVREDVDVVVRDGRIAAVEPHRPGRAAARRVDASDRTVIPGLWDSHIHPWQSTYGGRQTALQLAYGITTAVSLGGFCYEQARLREAVNSGELAGPRLLATGELLDGARVAYSMGRAHATRAGLRRSLARAAALDWDFVKTYVRAPGWVMAEAAAFAHDRLGVRTGSHLCSPGVQLGQDLTTHLQATQRLEYGHATSATGRAYGDVEEIYTAADFRLVATPFTAGPLLGADPALAEDPRVTALMPPWDATAVRDQAAAPPTEAQLATLDIETAVYRRILAGGGVVALGTDQPLVPVGLHLHLALRALHRAGLSVAETLRTATVLPARAFGAEDRLGTVEEGKLADLTIVAGDPFADLADLVRTESVLRGGVPFTQAELVESFSGTADPMLAAAHDDHWREVGGQLRRDGCCDGS
ncbi:amidohydrolase family protein [Allonocardiopsis opalescens]|uniref:Imidazolonepropionase-like amidohydrolase n=1 Tax=Allonocardiopsis opalescens TaxID=1144618 RepID=A0A2T0QES5_9ACTN|nr:amidohydrolase family protein [Allonocardiopsis opalescens]PRY02390.1 imidazolonepropionase-like amidohydrolase [Allonocardiopsis opalescens]